VTRLLILVAIVVGVLWWLFGRQRQDKEGGAKATRRPRKGTKASAPQIVACAHCGVHLPRDETVVDGEGRVYCDEAHRLAGPR
jgi:uncharacterized protein